MRLPVVVDTDVISFQLKRDTRAQLYEDHLRDRLVVVSFMTVAELERWTIAHNWGELRLLNMEEYLSNVVITLVDRALCRKWAEVVETASKAGFTISTADAWHAATALIYNVPLVTHNARDYRGVLELQLITEVI